MVDERQRIITSVFSRRNAQGVLEETYVSHVKIWEESDGGKKLRYILLSQAGSGTGYMHKSKLNSNGSFSVGKTWLLSDLRALHVLNPLSFNITLSRTYRWQTENQTDQINFLHSLIRLFRTGTSTPLRLEGITEPESVAGGDTTPTFDHALRSTHSSSPSGRKGESTPTKAQSGHVSPPHSPPNARYLPTIDRYRDTVSQSYPASFTPASQTTLQSEQYHQSDTDLTAVDIPSVSLYTARTEDSLEKKGTFLSSDAALGPTSERWQAIPQPSILQSPPESRTASPTPSVGPLKPNNGRNTESNRPVNRRDPKARISFFDSANQGVIDRLLLDNVSGLSSIEGEEETAQATMSSVEDMLEGYDWASNDVLGRKNAKGAVDLIEARLTGELVALENANIHSFLESDDQVMAVIKYMDEAIAELDNLDSVLSSYKIHLNAVSDDILHIQSQNRGLQVQTQNQRALLAEMENLLVSSGSKRERGWGNDERR
ncbi:hypothetical protein APHAL10511_006092 [Amanita phalloides]|nr:hypothetical protein APHAL10511_006092 [Amanita phalloides]